LTPVASPSRPSRLPLLALVSALAVAFSALRLAACFDDLWMDEIWALSLIAELNSPLEILTRLRTDNHLLHSIFVYAAGPDAPDWVHRLPSWLAGTVSVVLAGRIGRRLAWRTGGAGSTAAPRVAMILCILLVGGSPMLIQYDSEARGYGLAVTFGLLAFHALLAGEDDGRSRHAIVYWLAAALGLMAHPIFVHLLAGALVWSCVRLRGTGRSRREVVSEIAWWQGVPCAFAVLFYLGYLRLLQSGGAPRHDTLTILGNVCAYTLGVPIALGPATALALALVVSGLGVAFLVARRDVLWVFFATSVWLSPLALSLVTRPSFQFERYYVLSACLGLIWIGWLLARLWSVGRGGRIACGALLLAYTVVSGGRIVDQLRYGRGDYKSAIRYMAEQSEGDPVTVGSTHDFPNSMVFGYHLKRVAPEKDLRYLNLAERPPQGPQWMIHHRRGRTDWSGEKIRDREGNRYTLEITVPHAGFSGWHWFVYRNLGP
jgi:hypothetical protein